MGRREFKLKKISVIIETTIFNIKTLQEHYAQFR